MVRGVRLAAGVAFAVAAVISGGPPVAAADSGGAQVWSQAGCGSCHTLAAAGASGDVGPNLDQLRPSAAAVIAQVTTGGGGMPSFGHVLSSAQISSIATYVSSVAGSSTSAGTPVPAATPVVPASSLSAAAVRRLQLQLGRLGYFHGPVTGFYGPLTIAAVRRFQAASGLNADGVWGPASARELAGHLQGATTTTGSAGPATLPAPASWVKRLQQDLGRLGLFHGPDTGVYGPLTTAAVERLQSAAGIRVDGRWGPQSQQALIRRLAAAR